MHRPSQLKELDETLQSYEVSERNADSRFFNKVLMSYFQLGLWFSNIKKTKVSGSHRRYIVNCLRYYLNLISPREYTHLIAE